MTDQSDRTDASLPNETLDTYDALALTGDIVASYLTRNPLPANELPALIRGVHAALVGLGADRGGQPAPAPTKATPEQIKASISNGGLISFVDGKTYQTLKRHLAKHGLMPMAYRARYGLPADYPMTSPAYSKQRADMARGMGLGRHRPQAA